MADPFINIISGEPGATYCKVQVTRHGVALFNARWPCSRLDASRSYWIEFDADGNRVDSDIPEHSDGPEAAALGDDLHGYAFDNTRPEWCA